jgi:hypothetical protein
MREQLIEVTPVAGGWCVEAPGSLEPILFYSGACAEGAARRYALCIAALGGDVLVRIHDRQNLIVGDLHYFAM